MQKLKKPARATLVVHLPLLAFLVFANLTTKTTGVIDVLYYQGAIVNQKSYNFPEDQSNGTLVGFGA